MANNQKGKSDFLMPTSQHAPHQICKNVAVFILAATVVSM